MNHPNCDSKVVIRATNITAVILKDYLVGHDSERLMNVQKKPEPLAYDLIDFCQRCEKVYHFERKVEE